MKNPEHATLHQLAGELSLGDPVLAGEFAVLPLFLPGSGGESSKQPEPYVLLDEALPTGLVEVVEIGAGHVPEILVRNRGASPVLILEGDHLIGAKQNRAVWITILVPGKSETVIPVSCLEQGRWRYNAPGAAWHRGGVRGEPSAAPGFAACGFKVSPSIRASAARDISSSLKRGMGYAANQSHVWARVQGLSEDLGVNSPSSAYSDIAESRRGSIEEFLPRFLPLPGQSGAMVLIAGKLAGAEVSGSPATYAKLHRKILSPYLFDAIVMRARLDAPGAEAGAQAEKAGRFWLSAISDAPCELRRSVGLGRDFRMESQAVVGGGLENDGRIVYLSAFARSGLM